MSPIAHVATVNGALAVQRNMALENALIAERTPIVINNFGPAVIVNLSPAALAFLSFGDEDDTEAFLFAELFETLVAAESIAVNAAIAR